MISHKTVQLCLILVSGLLVAVPYPIVDTALNRFFDDKVEVKAIKKGTPFFGQDANYQGNKTSYSDHKNGTVTDNVTGLTWQQVPTKKETLADSIKSATKCRLGGFSDWRVPTIKELYSLIIFSGTDPDPMATSTAGLNPFIDTNYFPFKYGDSSKGERIIDSQYGSQTKYVSTTMNGNSTMFGVNFGDGRIKGYPSKKEFYFIFVRGNKNYGQNDFKVNPKYTISDRATGLMWMRVDSGLLKAGKMNWEEALAWAENLDFGGFSDWRLPNIKELQSIVDYSRSPKTTKSPAISPLFKLTKIKDEGGSDNFPCYWSSSTHKSTRGAEAADYIAFGEALGWMTDRKTGKKELLDVHGAGCQRSDPKSGDASQFPYGRGPQGDVIRIENYVICVRGGVAKLVTEGPALESKSVKRDSKSTKKGPSSDRRKGLIDKCDKDGDHRVSEKEFKGPSQHFKHLDKNRDGYITEDEAKNGKRRN